MTIDEILSALQRNDGHFAKDAVLAAVAQRDEVIPPLLETIARNRRLSGNRVLVELVELGLEARKQKEKVFFELAERLGDELGRYVFGE